MGQSKEEIIAMYINAIISDDEDLFVVEVRLVGDARNQRLQVFIDGDNGLDIDRCASISRQLGARLEEEDLFEGKYVLEVSSPGLDMPLKLDRQYHKNIGRILKVKTMAGDKYKGELAAVSDDQKITITVADDPERVIELELKEIEEAKVTVSFK